jgi:hypothetical protein
MMTETITQRCAFANGIPPQTLNNASATTGAVDLSLAHRAFAALYLGALTGGASVNARWQESPDNAAWTDVAADTSLANVSVTGKTASNKLETFEIRADQLAAGKRYVRLSVTETAGQNALVAALAWSDEGNHKPNSANNGTQVDTQSVAA